MQLMGTELTLNVTLLYSSHMVSVLKWNVFHKWVPKAVLTEYAKFYYMNQFSTKQGLEKKWS